MIEHQSTMLKPPITMAQAIGLYEHGRDEWDWVWWSEPEVRWERDGTVRGEVPWDDVPEPDAERVLLATAVRFGAGQKPHKEGARQCG